MTTAVFYFYSKSADKPPGKGANEKVAEGENYTELRNIKDWRKILSNFHVGEFMYKDKTYRTAEHCFQSQKIALVDTTKAHQFCVESGTPLAKGDGEAARKQRKMVVLGDKDLIQWNKMKFQVLEEILHARFSQVHAAQKVLLATKDAELWHGTRGTPKARQVQLEQVRKTLRGQNDQGSTPEPVEEASEKTHKQGIKRKIEKEKTSKARKKQRVVADHHEKSFNCFI
jgi:predicted NAD-dependent protein-ADP-ribosyltransferase YbiA (DUF1768 family)